MKKAIQFWYCSAIFFDPYYYLSLTSNGIYGMYLYLAPSLPDMSSLKGTLLKPLQVYTADNKLIAEYGGKLSIPVNMDILPAPLFMLFWLLRIPSFLSTTVLVSRAWGEL